MTNPTDAAKLLPRVLQVEVENHSDGATVTMRGINICDIRPQPAPPCEHEWETLHDGAVGCRKCYADKAVWETAQERERPAPPEGEPDDATIERVAEAIAMAGTSHFGDDTPYVQQDRLVRMMRRCEARAAIQAYRLGLAARPKVEDAAEALAADLKKTQTELDAEFHRAEAAEAKLAEREAELAKVLSDVGARWPHQIIEANHAARQQQKASADKDKPAAKDDGHNG